MILPLVLLLIFCQAPISDDEPEADPRTLLPIVPKDHGLSLDASADGHGAAAFTVQAAIDRNRVRVGGDAVTLTLTIRATGNVFRPPQMPDLASYPNGVFAGFDIEPQPPRAERTTWTFIYKLRPKDSKVKEVPAILLTYWDPVVKSQSPFIAWPVIETKPLPLEVLPLQVLPVPLAVPPGVDRFAPESALLAHEEQWQPPGIVMLMSIILIPPLFCLLLYALWKHRYPDALTAARRRRTAAARAALRELDASRRLPPAACAENSSAALARYLRSRLDMTLAEPTPSETAQILADAGLPGTAVQQTAAFLRSCDAARFGGASSARLPEEGSALVLLLEAEKWAPSSS